MCVRTFGRCAVGVFFKKIRPGWKIYPGKYYLCIRNRRVAGVVDRGRLEIGGTAYVVPGVRIPNSPQTRLIVSELQG